MTVKQLRDKLNEICNLGFGYQYMDIKLPNDEFGGYGDMKDEDIFVAQNGNERYCVVGIGPWSVGLDNGYEEEKVLWPWEERGTREERHDRKRTKGQTQQGS